MASPSVNAVFKRPFDEQVAFFRRKLGRQVPTAKWDDIMRSAHDSAFMVAGATKADLLSDLGAAVDRVIAEGKSLQAFRTDFRSIVQRRGWHGWTGEGSKKGEAWRTRIIYQTNAATSYSAGRLAQLREAQFEYWIYRHGGSADPRPEHLAWDGLTLPADDPFWQTHYPPNGWGCSCYVVGARSRDAAKRLGGSPDMRRPASFDSTDTKTGAPPGISKGWDYAPGDTVSTTVRQMAEKSRHWDYELAKGYMQTVPQAVRDQLAQSYRTLPSVAADARRFAARALREQERAQAASYQTLGLLTQADAQTVKGLAKVEVADFDYSLAASEVRHVQKRHGQPGRESKRGQRAVTSADYALLPRILNEGEPWEASGTAASTGHALIRRSLVHRGERFVAVFEVRSGRRTLSLLSFYVQRAQ